MERSSSGLEMKPGAVYQPIRVAITGTTVSPGIFDSLALLGRDETPEPHIAGYSGLTSRTDSCR